MTSISWNCDLIWNYSWTCSWIIYVVVRRIKCYCLIISQDKVCILKRVIMEHTKSVLIKNSVHYTLKEMSRSRCAEYDGCVCAGDSGPRARCHFTSKKSLAVVALGSPSVHNSLSLTVLRNLFINNTGCVSPFQNKWNSSQKPQVTWKSTFSISGKSLNDGYKKSVLIKDKRHLCKLQRREWNNELYRSYSVVFGNNNARRSSSAPLWLHTETDEHCFTAVAVKMSFDVKTKIRLPLNSLVLLFVLCQC